eukprot:CAMPEP_0195510802 /NCGR_PEP_ID=MMETSP0794_2-20130614/3332_1 /TAXON_ID=515487 /ORGANISM="Stephanopyxis turris, Strain CCMP 815" /LENGTH=1334 /DNA_ID=CAMNT_0040638291 /DNA_START=267 /DNA_END=4271 /DNA_ORIENTATION=+
MWSSFGAAALERANEIAEQAKIAAEHAKKAAESLESSMDVVAGSSTTGGGGSGSSAVGVMSGFLSSARTEEKDKGMAGGDGWDDDDDGFYDDNDDEEEIDLFADHRANQSVAIEKEEGSLERDNTEKVKQTSDVLDAGDREVSLDTVEGADTIFRNRMDGQLEELPQTEETNGWDEMSTPMSSADLEDQTDNAETHLDQIEVEHPKLKKTQDTSPSTAELDTRPLENSEEHEEEEELHELSEAGKENICASSDTGSDIIDEVALLGERTVSGDVTAFEARKEDHIDDDEEETLSAKETETVDELAAVVAKEARAQEEARIAAEEHAANDTEANAEVEKAQIAAEQKAATEAKVEAEEGASSVVEETEVNAEEEARILAEQHDIKEAGANAEEEQEVSAEQEAATKAKAKAEAEVYSAAEEHAAAEAEVKPEEEGEDRIATEQKTTTEAKVEEEEACSNAEEHAGIEAEVKSETEEEKDRIATEAKAKVEEEARSAAEEHAVAETEANAEEEGENRTAAELKVATEAKAEEEEARSAAEEHATEEANFENAHIVEEEKVVEEQAAAEAIARAEEEDHTLIEKLSEPRNQHSHQDDESKQPEKELTERNAQIQHLHNLALQKQLSAVQKQLSDQESQTKYFQSVMEERERQLLSKYQELAEKDEQLSNALAQQNQPSSDSQEREKQTQESDDRILALQEQLSLSQNELSKQEAQTTQLRTVLEEREKQLLSKHQELVDKEEELETKGQEIISLFQMHEQVKKDLKDTIKDTKEEAKRRIQRAKERVDENQNKMEQMKHKAQLDVEALAKKDLIIEEVRAEGEALSKMHVKADQSFRAERSKVRDLKEMLEEETKVRKGLEEKNAQMKEQLKEANKNLGVAQKGAGSADMLSDELVSAKEKISQSQAINASLENQIIHLQNEIKNAREDLQQAKKEAREEEEEKRKIYQKERDDLMADMEEKLRRSQREANLSEDALRREIAEMRKRWQDSVTRADSLSMDIQHSTAPLMRQLDSAERQARVRSAAWAEVESRLRRSLDERDVQNEKLSKELTEYKNKIVHTEKVLKASEGNLGAAQKSINLLRSEVDRLEQELEKIEKEKEEWVNVEELSAESATKNQNESKISDTTEERYLDEIEELRNDLNAEKSMRIDLELKVKTLTQSNNAVTVPKENKKKVEKKLMAATNQADILQSTLFGLEEDRYENEEYNDAASVPNENPGMDAGSFAAMEQLSQGLKEAKIDLESFRKRLASSEESREKLNVEVMDLRHSNEQLSLLEAEVTELSQLVAEKDQEVLCLREDMMDIKHMYQEQLNSLMGEQQCAPGSSDFNDAPIAHI